MISLLLVSDSEKNLGFKWDLCKLCWMQLWLFGFVKCITLYKFTTELQQCYMRYTFYTQLFFWGYGMRGSISFRVARIYLKCIYYPDMVSESLLSHMGVDTIKYMIRWIYPHPANLCIVIVGTLFETVLIGQKASKQLRINKWRVYIYMLKLCFVHRDGRFKVYKARFI